MRRGANLLPVRRRDQHCSTADSVPASLSPAAGRGQDRAKTRSVMKRCETTSDKHFRGETCLKIHLHADGHFGRCGRCTDHTHTHANTHANTHTQTAPTCYTHSMCTYICVRAHALPFLHAPRRPRKSDSTGLYPTYTKKKNDMGAHTNTSTMAAWSSPALVTAHRALRKRLTAVAHWRHNMLCMYTSLCIHVCMFVYMYVCMYVCVYVCMHVCMHVCMYACMHVCMYACMHVCMSQERTRQCSPTHTPPHTFHV